MASSSLNLLSGQLARDGACSSLARPRASSTCSPTSRCAGKQFGRPAALDAGQRRRIAERHANGKSMAALAKDYEVGVATSGAASIVRPVRGAPGMAADASEPRKAAPHRRPAAAIPGGKYLPWNAVVHHVPVGVTPELAGLVPRWRTGSNGRCLTAASATTRPC
jgi:hypothetical protein